MQETPYNRRSNTVEGRTRSKVEKSRTLDNRGPFQEISSCLPKSRPCEPRLARLVRCYRCEGSSFRLLSRHCQVIHAGGGTDRIGLIDVYLTKNNGAAHETARFDCPDSRLGGGGRRP